MARSTSVQKGRFTVMDDGESEGGGGGKGSHPKLGDARGGVKGSASSMIIGASEPDPGAVAAAAAAAAAAEREMDPPRIKVRALFEAAEAAAEHASALKALHEEMQEQEEKITQLIDDNRWLRRRVKELEARNREERDQE
jgi:hypothetical protein